MAEQVNRGDIVRHVLLKDTPEMYVVHLRQEEVTCRYFSHGSFYIENFLYSELIRKEDELIMLKDQSKIVTDYI
jgi:hypothetical protein